MIRSDNKNYSNNRIYGVITSMDYPFMSIINRVTELSNTVTIEYYDRKIEKIYKKFLSINYHFFMK